MPGRPRPLSSGTITARSASAGIVWITPARPTTGPSRAPTRVTRTPAGTAGRAPGGPQHAGGNGEQHSGGERREREANVGREVFRQQRERFAHGWFSKREATKRGRRGGGGSGAA